MDTTENYLREGENWMRPRTGVARLLMTFASLLVFESPMLAKCETVSIEMVKGTLTADIPSVVCDRGGVQQWKTTEKGRLLVTFVVPTPFKAPACGNQTCTLRIGAPHRPDDVAYKYIAKVTYADDTVEETEDPEVVVPGIYPFLKGQRVGLKEKGETPCDVDACVVLRAVDGIVVADPEAPEVQPGGKVRWSVGKGVKIKKLHFINPGDNHATKRDNDKRIPDPKCSSRQCTMTVGNLTKGYRYIYIAYVTFRGKSQVVDPELVVK